jgi:hypothetical protein
VPNVIPSNGEQHDGNSCTTLVVERTKLAGGREIAGNCERVDARKC